MSEQMNSPLPWAADEWNDFVDASGAPVIKNYHDGYQISAADTALIVRAVNSHERLVAALKNIVNSLADQDDEGMIEHAEQMIAARAALAAAGAA